MALREGRASSFITHLPPRPPPTFAPLFSLLGWWPVLVASSRQWSYQRIQTKSFNSPLGGPVVVEVSVKRRGLFRAAPASQPPGLSAATAPLHPSHPALPPHASYFCPHNCCSFAIPPASLSPVQGHFQDRRLAESLVPISIWSPGPHITGPFLGPLSHPSRSLPPRGETLHLYCPVE